MPRARPAIRASPSGRWLTLKSRYQNTRAKVKTTARARAVARIRVKTRAKEREAARPTEASRSSNQPQPGHIGGCLGDSVKRRDLHLCFPGRFVFGPRRSSQRTGGE